MCLANSNFHQYFHSVCDIQANVSSVALHYPYILKTYLGLQSWHLDQVRARVLFSREGVKQSGKQPWHTVYLEGSAEGHKSII